MANASKQFIIYKFKQYIANIEIIIKNILFEVHNFIRLVKHYHSSFCEIYTLIIAKISKINPELALKIFFKVLNNLVKLNNFVLTLLLFGIYFCITKIDISLLIII